MNNRQQQQYQRGLETAQRDMLEVRGHGTVKATGAAVYAVPSRSQQNVWHLVVVNGLELSQVRQDAREREIERAFHAAARALNVTLETAPALDRSPRPRDDTRVFSLYK